MERRRQADRSAAMQRRLVDAAIDLLLERGWAATTAVAVCERAGCTRGALMHHFPSLSALFARALESLYEDLTDKPQSAAIGLVGVVDQMWAVTGDPRFKAVMEAWSAAGNDPELATEVGPAIARFAKVVSPSNAPARSAVANPNAKAFVFMAREAMLGLALGRATNGGKPLGHERVVIARLRDEAARLDDEGRS
ncbi:MAG: hypothetical protein QOF21_1539 [Actinomycetota bacterium]|jgi:AcrR family transcriptional regulator